MAENTGLNKIRRRGKPTGFSGTRGTKESIKGRDKEKNRIKKVGSCRFWWRSESIKETSSRVTKEGGAGGVGLRFGGSRTCGEGLGAERKRFWLGSLGFLREVELSSLGDRGRANSGEGDQRKRDRERAGHYGGSLGALGFSLKPRGPRFSGECESCLREERDVQETAKRLAGRAERRDWDTGQRLFCTEAMPQFHEDQRANITSL